MQTQPCQGGRATVACSVLTEAQRGPSAAGWLRVLSAVLSVLNKRSLLLLAEPVCSQRARSALRPLTRHPGWQELLGHCTALYQENQRRICDLERHLRQYGYKAEFLAPQLGQTRTSGSDEAVVGPGASADPSIVSFHSVTGFVRLSAASRLTRRSLLDRMCPCAARRIAEMLLAKAGHFIEGTLLLKANLCTGWGCEER